MQPLTLQIDEMIKGTEFMSKNIVALKYDLELYEKQMKAFTQNGPKQQSKNKPY